MRINDLVVVYPDPDWKFSFGHTPSSPAFDLADTMSSTGTAEMINVATH